jgi:hypothetical protein
VLVVAALHWTAHGQVTSQRQHGCDSEDPISM